MNRARRQEINAFAEHVRRVLDQPSPVDLFETVQRLNGNIERVTFDNGVAGQIIRNGQDSFTIYIEKSHPPNRQRFSIAHELGHLFLHMGYMVDPKKWASVGTYMDSAMYRFGHSEEESEADEFAAAFLMPRDEFRKIAFAYLYENAFQLQPIADHFGVSVISVKIRGRWLGFFSWD